MRVVKSVQNRQRGVAGRPDVERRPAKAVSLRSEFAVRLEQDCHNLRHETVQVREHGESGRSVTRTARAGPEQT